VSIGGIFKPTMDRIEKLHLQILLGDLGGEPPKFPAPPLWSSNLPAAAWDEKEAIPILPPRIPPRAPRLRVSIPPTKYRHSPAKPRSSSVSSVASCKILPLQSF
jgi:hypothetical protein